MKTLLDMNILIVDDSRTDREIIKDILTEAGYKSFIIASSADETFSILAMHDPLTPLTLLTPETPLTPVDLILMDIVMPGINGLEACGKIREKEFLKDIPIIMVTARPNDENLQLAFEKGANDYITKPLNRIELITRVRSTLKLKMETDNRKARELELKHLTESLRYFKKAVENMQIGVTISNPEGQIIYANPAEERIHGYDQGELSGCNVSIFSQPELRKPMTVMELKKLKSWRRESINIKKEGTVFPVHLLSDTVTDAQGIVTGVVTTCEDITERKRSEEMLKKTREELEKRVRERTKELTAANAALKEEVQEKLAFQAETVRAAHLASLGELSAGVAHEINNPINGIINCAQILVNRRSWRQKEKEICGMIISEGKRVANIVQALLSFAREREGEKKPVHLGNIMGDSLALTSAHLRRDGINLSLDIPVDLPVVVAHHQQIQQVFLNLINNAHYALNQKYPKGNENKSLIISAERVFVNKRKFVRVTFLDNGTGIPSDIMDKVMDPFFSTKPEDKGTGLGLSISHGIIADHGGRLSIESKEGEFTKVILDLPAAER
ncbi:MAG: response regulator [Deltaproteobacteria bacterium]|nr:response regulator [Deltaproteobacteria bacterium]